jgi:hypothetical protein
MNYTLHLGWGGVGWGGISSWVALLAGLFICLLGIFSGIAGNSIHTKMAPYFILLGIFFIFWGINDFICLDVAKKKWASKQEV